MKTELILGLVDISEVAKVTGTSNQNIRNNYVKNYNGKNKTAMLKALAIGAYMMEKKLTIKDVKNARKLALALKSKDEE